MFLSLSSIERASADAYMKLMLALALSYEFDYDQNFYRKMTAWRKAAEPFMKQFRIKTKDLDIAYRNIIANKGPENDVTHESTVEAFREMQLAKPKFEKELDLTRDDLRFLNDMRLVALKDSEQAKIRIAKELSRFNDPDFNSMFAEDHESTEDVQKELKALVQKFGKVSGLIMPTTVLESWQEYAKNRGKKLPQHERYLELTRTLRESYKKRLRSLILSSDKPYLPVSDVIRTLDSEGVPHNLPSNFIGNIDAEGKFYTTSGKRLLQAPSGDVLMNPEYDPKKDNSYVCSFTPAFAQAPTRAYTENYRSSAKQSKFDVVMEALPLIPAAAKKWRSAMAKPNTKAGILATLAELIYETSARVSSKVAMTGGERTFGATTLQVQHIKFSDSVINIVYTGKSAGKQHHVIKLTTPALKRLAANLKIYCIGKAKTDPVFEYKDRTVTGTAVSNYLRTLGLPDGFTVHKFRTIRATEMANDVLKACPFKKGGQWTDKQVHQWVEGEILKVGIALGHMSGEKYTANTAIQNYVDPGILKAFYDKLGIRPNPKIQKAIDSINKHEK